MSRVALRTGCIVPLLLVASCGRTFIAYDRAGDEPEAPFDAGIDVAIDVAPPPDAEVPECPAGENLCGGECVPESVLACGPSCVVCPAAPPFGAIACTGGTCTLSCDDGYQVCGDVCCRPQVVAGGSHTCALGGDARVRCWGSNAHGQLGDGTTQDRLTPTEVSGLAGIIALSAGADHTCAIQSDRAVYCWGRNDEGQLGDGTRVDRTIPTSVGITASAIAAGQRLTCAIADGLVTCWGSFAGTRFLAPTTVTGIGHGEARAITAGDAHACALTWSRGVKCWGTGYALGRGTFVDSLVAVEPDGLSSGVASVTASSNGACVVRDEGRVSCWGWSSHGQLGTPNIGMIPAPFDVPGIDQGQSLALGTDHSCALLQDGAVQCWGDTSQKQYARPPGSWPWIPVDVTGFPAEVVALSARHHHTCAALADGRVVCWGSNAYGQLGDGTHISSESPVEVLGL